jgi:hypothetical protein
MGNDHVPVFEGGTRLRRGRIRHERDRALGERRTGGGATRMLNLIIATGGVEN